MNLPYTWENDGCVEDGTRLAELYWSIKGQPKTVPSSAVEDTEKVSEGKRHKLLLSHAGKLLRTGITSEEALTVELLQFNTERCDPPKPEAVIRKLAEDTYRRYKTEPGPVLILGPDTSPQSFSALLMTVGESLAERPDIPRWFIDGFIPQGGNVLGLTALPKIGKTTLVLDAFRDMLNGEAWCGRDTQKTRILYLTEQGQDSFNEQLDLAEMPHDAMQILYRDRCLGWTWQAIAKGAINEAKTGDCGTIVVDTFYEWLGRPDISENSPEIIHYMRELCAPAKAAGICTFFLFHSVKDEERDLSCCIRGSTAITGYLDHVFRLRRAKSKNKSARIMEARGRLQGILAEVSFDFADDRYLITIGGEAVSFSRTCEILRTILPSTPDKALSEKTILTATKSSRMTVRRALKAIGACSVQDGVISKSNPKRYYLPIGDSDHGDSYMSPVDGQNKKSPLNNPPDLLKPISNLLIFHGDAIAATQKNPQEAIRTPEILSKSAKTDGQNVQPSLIP
jgi:hypothetical protein